MEFDGDNLLIERYSNDFVSNDDIIDEVMGGAKSLEERLAAAIVRADRARDTANRMVREGARARALDRVARLDEKTDLIRLKINQVEQKRREREEIKEIKRQTAAAKKAEEKQIRDAQRAIKKAETKERARLKAIAKRAADREAAAQAAAQAAALARAAERKREEEEEKKKIFENNLFFIVDVASAKFNANNLITMDLTPTQIRAARGDKDNRIYMAHKNSPAAKELTKYLKDHEMLNGSNIEMRSIDEEREKSPLQELLLNAMGINDRFYVEHELTISGLNFPDFDPENGILLEYMDDPNRNKPLPPGGVQATLLETMTDVLQNAIQGARDYILKADDYIELPFKYFNGRHYERAEYVPNPEWSDETNKFQKGIFDNNNVIHPCVVNVLINKYSKLGANICISEKSITQFFEDAAYGLKDRKPPSIGLLCDFCKLYNIELHIYDIFKKRFIYEENKRDNRKTNKRPPLICMCFDNHIYNYTLPPTKEINFTMKPMDEYDYENCPVNFTKIIIDERADEILKLVQPNFTAPYDVQKMRAISYTFPDAGGLGDNFMPLPQSGSIYTIDLISAYYNAQTEFYKYTGVKCLPCFSACDFWKVGTPPSHSGVVAVGYYRIDEEAFNFIRRFYGICGNLLSDFLINFFITNKMMKLSNVIAYKTASYTLPTELLAKRMKELVNKIKEEYKGNLIKDFSIFNGIFGYTRTNRTQHAEISKLDDIKLIALNHPEAIVSDNTNTKLRKVGNKVNELIQENDKDISMREKKRFCFDMYDYPIDTITTTSVMINKETEHRYFNSLNIYNYTVDITNLLICMKIKQLRDGGFRILKAMTDDITFRYNLAAGSSDCGGSSSVIITPELLGIRPPQTPNGDPDQNYPSIFKLKDNKPGRSSAPCVKYEFSQLITDQQNSYENIGDNIKGYQGAPGVGKTYTVQHNHTYDYAMTTTNICARNMDSKNADGVEIIAKTLYSAFKIYEQHKIEENLSVFRDKILWLDEYSLMKKYMWSFIYVLAIKFNVSFIISGDIYQLPPVGEKSIDLHDKFFSTIFKNIITLEDGEYSRNDAELIKLRNCINELQRGERATRYKGKIFHRVGDLITSLCCPTGSIDNTKMPIADNFICYTNEYKDFLNAEIMKAKAHTVKADFVNADSTTRSATAMRSVFKWECSTGAIISPVCNRKSIIRPNLYKNDRYKVVKGGSGDSPDDEIIVQVIRLVKSQPPVGCNVIDGDYNDPIQSLDPAARLDPNTTITLKSIELGLMAPSYAFTCHCSQGMTLEGLLEIHQCDDIEKMNYRDNSGSNWIYTAATRSRALANIKFINKSETFTKLPKKQRGEIILQSLKEFFDVSGIQPKLLSQIDKEFSQLDELTAQA